MLRTTFTMPDDPEALKHVLIMEGLIQATETYAPGEEVTLDGELLGGEDITDIERVLWEQSIPFETWLGDKCIRHWDADLDYPALVEV